MKDPLDPKIHSKPLRFFLAVSKRDLHLYCLTAFFYTLGMSNIIIGPYLLGRIIDTLNLHTGPPVSLLVFLLLLSVALHEIFYRIGHTSEMVFYSRLRRNIKKALFDHTASLSFSYFADRFAGEIGHKISGTTENFDRLAVIVVNNFIEDGILVAFGIAALATVHPWFGWYLGLWSLLFLAFLIPYVRNNNTKALAYAAQEARSSGILVDTYGNIGSVKVYGKLGDLGRVYSQIDRETDAYRTMGMASVLLYNYQGISRFVLAAGLTGISVHLFSHGQLTLGQLAFVVGAGMQLLGLVWSVGPSLTNFIRARGEIKQNLKDLLVAPAVVDGPDATEMKQEMFIEYRNVTFSYVEERPILERFSLKIQPKEKLGIVGLSGAGKTTFANLLLRFFDVQEGAILLGGRDIREFTQEYLRSHISYISQDTSLFHASIAENIAYGSPAASQVEIEKAAKLAYADEFINLLPKKYESVVGERGIKLSGGQRQRIAVARAILADRPLFLLDEATSALDSDSEKKIQKALTTLMEGKTVIAIAHRLSTLSHMDRIIFLENGAIAEQGTHDELLKQNGKYAQLWHLQAGGFLPDTI